MLNDRFTVFDVMEKKGVFAQNPANASSPAFAGPVKFPKMLYHPTGQTRIVQAAEEINTPFGPKRVGERSEIIHRIVGSPDEEAKWLAEGWHTHPAKAIAAGGGEAPATSSAEEIESLQDQIKVLQSRLEASTEGAVPTRSGRKSG